jgi:hypothetical protein
MSTTCEPPAHVRSPRIRAPNHAPERPCRRLRQAHRAIRHLGCSAAAAAFLSSTPVPVTARNRRSGGLEAHDARERRPSRWDDQSALAIRKHCSGWAANNASRSRRCGAIERESLIKRADEQTAARGDWSRRRGQATRGQRQVGPGRGAIEIRGPAPRSGLSQARPEAI